MVKGAASLALVLALSLPARGSLIAHGPAGGEEPRTSRGSTESGETARASGDTPRWPFSREPSETPQDVEKLLENLRVRLARAIQERSSASKVAHLKAEAAKLNVRLRISMLRRERDELKKSGDRVQAQSLDVQVHGLKQKLKALETGETGSGASRRPR